MILHQSRHDTLVQHHFFFRKSGAGFALLEVVIALALFLSVVAIFGAYYSGLRTSLVHTERVKATLLAEEGLEVVRLLRDQGWNTSLGAFAIDESYWLLFDGSDWSATLTPQPLIDGAFERTVVFSEVYRDGNDYISESGSEDDGTRKATVTVSWQTGTTATSTYTLEGYFSDIFN